MQRYPYVRLHSACIDARYGTEAGQELRARIAEQSERRGPIDESLVEPNCGMCDQAIDENH